MTEAETRSPYLLIMGYNNNVKFCDDISIDWFVSYFFTPHVITRVSYRTPLYHVVLLD